MIRLGKPKVGIFFATSNTISPLVAIQELGRKTSALKLGLFRNNKLLKKGYMFWN